MSQPIGQLPPIPHRPISLAHPRVLQRMVDVLPLALTIEQTALERDLSQDGAEQLRALGFDWVYLNYFDGFPRTETATDQAYFETTIRQLHNAGLGVSACIRVSSAVRRGDYAERTWYASDSKGQLLPAGAQRFYTIMQHADWQAEIAQIIKEALALGFDGIVFSEVSMGADGYTLGNLTMGVIGSDDSDTREAFGVEHIPFRWRNTQHTHPYLVWRAEQLAQIVNRWVGVVQEINPTCLLELELRDPLTRPTMATQGVNLSVYQSIAGVQFLSTHPDHDTAWWVHNIVASGMSQQHRKMVKISLDEILYHTVRVLPPRSYAHNIARALALGEVPLVQGIIKRHSNSLSSLLHSRYLPYQSTLAAINQWQIANEAWLYNRQPASPLAIYFPSEAWQQFGRTTVVTISMMVHALMARGYPVRFIGDSEWEHVEFVLVPAKTNPDVIHSLQQAGLRVIGVGRGNAKWFQQRIWIQYGERLSPIRMPTFIIRRLNYWAVRVARAYHKFQSVRRVFDWVKRRAYIQRRLLPVKVPLDEMVAELAEVLPDSIPHVNAPHPLLYTIWCEPDGTQQHYLVNTMREAQATTLHLNQLVSAEIYVPQADASPSNLVGSSLAVTVDVAKVIRAELATIQATDVD